MHGRIISIPHTEPIPMFCLPIVSLPDPNVTYCYTINTSAELQTVSELQFIVERLEEALIVIAITMLKTDKETENNNGDQKNSILEGSDQAQ